MAKTSYSIYLDYQKAMNQADRLDDAARMISAEMKNLQNCKSKISSSWQGESATSYIRKVNVVEDDLTRMAKSIKKTADAIRKIARATYDAEQQALELAKERKV